MVEEKVLSAERGRGSDKIKEGMGKGDHYAGPRSF